MFRRAFPRTSIGFTEFLALIGLTSLIVGGVGVANAAQGFVERKRADSGDAEIDRRDRRGGRAARAYRIRRRRADRRRLRAGARRRAAIRGRRAVRRDHSFSARACDLSRRTWRWAWSMVCSPRWCFRSRLWGGRMTCRFRRCFATRRNSPGAWPRPRYLAASALAALALAGLAVFESAETAPRDHRRRGDDARLHRAAPRRARRDGACASRAAIARRRLAHGARQYSPARRDDALRRAVARPRPRRARHADADRQQSARRIASELPGETPSFYFLDVRSAEIDGFRAFLADNAPDAKIVDAPMMRGRFVKIGRRRPKRSRPRKMPPGCSKAIAA